MNTTKLALINKCFKGCLVKCGQKQRALKIYYNVLGFLKKNTTTHPLFVILRVVEKLKPSVSLRAKKVGGTSHNLPYLISDKKAFSIAIHWVIKEAKLRSERTVDLRLGYLILENFKLRNSQLFKKKDAIHKVALSNRAFLNLKKQ